MPALASHSAHLPEGICRQVRDGYRITWIPGQFECSNILMRRGLTDHSNCEEAIRRTSHNVIHTNIPMLQHDTNSSSSLGEDIRDAGVEEGQPVFAARLPSINYNDRSVVSRDVVSLVDPESLPESWRALGEVIEGLGEPLLRKFLGHG